MAVLNHKDTYVTGGCMQDPRATVLPPYRIATLEGPHAILSLNVVPELTCLQGHFPEKPIVPGIALLDWAVQLADQVFGCGRAVGGVRNLKFKKVVEPQAHLELTLEHQPERDRVKFTIASAFGEHASGIVELVRS
ncbi:hypothetical protein [Ruegeria sp. MALMAid1280]|uniref:ApeI family dehydratase n=1 Tax=Ruegeria sp. MALMAid1280 TaxID=3411634 RepID=UPI003BA21D05